jgi:hypothetical protein
VVLNLSNKSSEAFNKFTTSVKAAKVAHLYLMGCRVGGAGQDGYLAGPRLLQALAVKTGATISANTAEVAPTAKYRYAYIVDSQFNNLPALITVKSTVNQ